MDSTFHQTAKNFRKYWMQFGSQSNECRMMKHHDDSQIQDLTSNVAYTIFYILPTLP